jgi:uncharacterized protein (TIGR02444 family)
MATGDRTSLDLLGPQWDFAVQVYQRPRVSEACLVLQDALAVDVCLLLFALFAAKECGILLDREGLEDLDQVIAGWRDNVVRPLRAIRRYLKTEPPPTPGSATHTLREQIKKSELDAEQIELAMLARQFGEHPRAARTETADVRAVLDDVAAFFAARSDNTVTQAPEIRSALRDIASAMEQE